MALPQSFDIDSPTWLRSLRWVAILGMASSTLGAALYGVHIFWTPLAILLGLLVLWNFFLPQLEAHFVQSQKAFVFLQLQVDLLFLTAILWCSGGLVNPFATFYIFHVMLAGLLLNPLLTAMTTFFASCLVILLTWAPALQIGEQTIQLRASPIWVGIPIGLILLIFFTNIFILAFLSRLGKANEERRQRMKMEALGRLVGGLAHEIGTPLNSILLLAKDADESSAESVKKDLDLIYKQAKRCGDIVALLLGYSRGLARSEEIKFTKVHLPHWLEEIHRSLEAGSTNSDPATKLHFKVELESVAPEMEIPELILRQVFLNLFKNARDATEHVHNPEIRVRIYQDELEKELCFTVQDNGPGFTKETKEKAFDAFFTTKKQGLGVGLGLYISYYLIDQVCGRIAIEDSLEPGAKIKVALPYASRCP